MSSLSKIKIPFIIFIFLALFVIQSCAVIPKNFTVKEPQYDIKTEEFSLKFEELKDIEEFFIKKHSFIIYFKKYNIKRNSPIK
jgi:hypothetical protein